MSTLNIRKAIQSLKLKNSEGYDRIPQRILIDGKSKLVEPFSVLFNLIYSTNKIPEEWSMSKINNKIDYLWFNESLNSFKIKCKKLLLQ